MKVIHGIPARRMRTPLCLAAGIFDGVHVGHQEIISAAVQLAAVRGCMPAVLTFAPHPDTVLLRRPMPPLLTTIEEKTKLLRSLGVQLTIVARFDAGFAAMPAEQFVEEVVVNRLNACCLTVGEGWRFGARGRGDGALLQQLARRHDFFFCGCPSVKVGGDLVSSTRIRHLIAAGDVASAACLLGRPYQLSNVVQPGRRVGRTLGFPTANLEPPPFKAIPANGVYAGWAGVTEWAPAVINLGVRPTLETHGARLIEVHLLDQSPKPRLAERRLHVAFVEVLRRERRFESPRALVTQIAEDCAHARSVLAALQPPALML